jgi:putative tryptophan/tyrosine transport system substrate-binding protein
VRRRGFTFVLFTAAACLWPFGIPRAADAQQTASPWRIGVLLVARSPGDKELQAFRRGLLDAGYSEGRELVIEWRFARGDYTRVPELVVDLIRRQVEVIVVDTTVATRAAKSATSTIPIVMTSIADPVGSGLVASLAHPGENVTGLSIMATDLIGKRLQVLKETLPRLTRVGVLWNPDTQYSPKVVEELRSVAPSLEIQLSFATARAPEEFGSAFSAFRREHAQALYVLEDSVFFVHRTTLNKLTSQARLPAIFAQARVVEEGGLISYGPNFADLFHRAAGYVDKILKGAKPGDLPIEQPTKFELAVNLKTAGTLGITIPESILLRADEAVQ